MGDEILSKEPWPHKGIDRYSSIEDGEWGYLVHYRDKGLVFEDSKRPSENEIIERWGSKLASNEN